LDEAASWWIRAGEQAARQSTTVDAIRLLERALTLVPRSQAHSARRAEVLNQLGVQYIAAHGYASPLVERAFGEAAEILEICDVPGQLFTALWGLHVHAMVRSDIPRAVEIGTRMLGLAEAEGDPQKVLQVHRLQGLARLLMGAHSEAARHYAQVLRQYDPVVHRSHRFQYGGEPAALALAQLAWSEWVGGRIALSDRHALEATGHARKTEHAHSIVYVTAVNALRLLTARQFSDSAEAAAEAHYLAEKNGFPYWIAWCDIILAALERPADPDRGRTLLAAAIQRYEQTGARQLIPYAHALEAECCLDLHFPTEAKLALDAALRLVEETGVRLYQAELLRLRACTAYRLGENGDALLEASLKLAHNQVARSFELRSLVTGVEEAVADETRRTARNSLMRLLLEMTNEPETIDISAARRRLTH
jgi:predicted ATPase